MELPFRKISDNEDITGEIAKQFASVLSEGDIVLLNGELGSGKTLFVKKICDALDIQGVTSPTFSIVNEYYGKLKIYHFDFYRINNFRELQDIGFEEYLDDVESLIFIEWSDMFPEAVPAENIYRVDFKQSSENIREISIKFII